MRVVWTALALAFLALAGCAEDESPVEEDDATFDDFDVKVDEDTGIIRGVVVDPSITPIEGALVVLVNQDMETTSNANGAFLFSDLAPGSYFLTVTKTGFAEVQASAEVQAGVESPAVVKVQLTPDASTRPFIQPLTYDAYIQCSESLVLVGYSGGCSNDFLVSYGSDVLGRTPEYAQSEMIWESTQPLGDWMTLLYSTNPLPGETLLYNYVDVEGPSPLVAEANRTLMEENDVIAGYPLQVRIFNSGLEGTDIGRDYGDPRDGDDCVERPQLGGCTTGVGATVDQILTVYTHAFFNFEPDPEWQFTRDGDHPVPE